MILANCVHWSSDFTIRAVGRILSRIITAWLSDFPQSGHFLHIVRYIILLLDKLIVLSHKLLDFKLLIIDGSQQPFLLLEEYSFIILIPSLLGHIVRLWSWDKIICVSVDVKSTILKSSLYSIEPLLEHKMTFDNEIFAQMLVWISQFELTLPLIEQKLLATLNSRSIKLSWYLLKLRIFVFELKNFVLKIFDFGILID